MYLVVKSAICAHEKLMKILHQHCTLRFYFLISPVVKLN